jgi:hypothetical protein
MAHGVTRVLRLISDSLAGWLGTDRENAIPDISQTSTEIAQRFGFTRKCPKERRIGDYGRLRKYFLWDQGSAEVSAGL